jgi:hypothetical protein
MNIDNFKKLYRKALEITNLDESNILLKDDSLLVVKESKQLINSGDEYIRVAEFEKSNGDKIYSLLVNFKSLLLLNDNEITCHLYNALSYIKTTYINNNGLMKSLTYLTFIKEANLIDVLNKKYNKYYEDLVFVYGEVEELNKSLLPIHEMLMISDNNLRFNAIYDLSFKDINIEQFVYIIVSEFYTLGTNFDDLISIFKTMFIYFNYKLFKGDEAYSLLVKSYDHDYSAKYRSYTIKPYDFILLVDSFLTNEITLNEFIYYLMDYYNVLINKDKKSINKELLKKEYHYSSGDLKFEI